MRVPQVPELPQVPVGPWQQEVLERAPSQQEALERAWLLQRVAGSVQRFCAELHALWRWLRNLQVQAPPRGRPLPEAPQSQA